MDRRLPPLGEEEVNQVDPSRERVRLTALELCAAGEVRCSAKTSRPSAATVRTIGAHLAQGDFYDEEPIAAFAWPSLLRAGGFAALDGTRLRLTPKGRAALGKPPAESIRHLWRRWLTHAVIDEFSRIEQIKGQHAPNVLTSAKTRRRMVATALATCPEGEGLDVGILFSRMRHDGMSPTVVRTDRALWKLYLVDPEYGSLGYEGYHEWELLEGRYTLAVLFEYAATLGLVDLNYTPAAEARHDFHDNWGADELDALSRYDGLQEIRLTALGAYALGLVDTYRTSNTGSRPLTVLTNLDIVATGEVEAADRLVLSAYAEQTADRVWTVSAASLLAALDNGRALRDLTDFLAERTEHDLPGAFRALVDDVDRRSTQLTDLGQVRLKAS